MTSLRCPPWRKPRSKLVYWLEDRGYPAIIVPPTHVDPWRYNDDPKAHMTTLISLPHAAVEAGLGTLGLNQQLLTPEFGPRVILTAVMASLDVEPDRRRSESLCYGPYLWALPVGVSGRCGSPLGPRLGGLRHAAFALWFRKADRAYPKR